MIAAYVIVITIAACVVLPILLFQPIPPFLPEVRIQ